MIKIIPMTKKHIKEVSEIEKRCFTIPWSKESFKNEITKNSFAIYIVAMDTENKKLAGYGGMWHVVNEGHITNIAVDAIYRRKGIGELILNELIRIGCKKQMIGLTLEVRVNNEPAKNLYKKLGFKLEGIRKEYYNDTKEDALIMWKYLTPKQLIQKN